MAIYPPTPQHYNNTTTTITTTIYNYRVTCLVIYRHHRNIAIRLLLLLLYWYLFYGYISIVIAGVTNVLQQSTRESSERSSPLKKANLAPLGSNPVLPVHSSNRKYQPIRNIRKILPFTLCSQEFPDCSKLWCYPLIINSERFDLYQITN